MLTNHMQALKHVEIDAALQKFLLRPQREIHVELVITMDNGEVQSFNAYRVQHNNFRGPYKGGYRLAPDVDMQEMRRYMTICRLICFEHMLTAVVSCAVARVQRLS